MRQVRYRPKDRTKRKEYDPDFQPVMVGDLRRRGELLEIGCTNCGRHGVYDLNANLLLLRDDIPIYLAPMYLVCSNCGARNMGEAPPSIWAQEDKGRNTAPHIDHKGCPIRR